MVLHFLVDPWRSATREKARANSGRRIPHRVVNARSTMQSLGFEKSRNLRASTGIYEQSCRTSIDSNTSTLPCFGVERQLDLLLARCCETRFDFIDLDLGSTL